MDRSASEPESESVLIERALLGDQAAFESLMHRYSSVLFAFVRRHTRDDEQGEDIVQFVWLQLYLSLPQLSHHLSSVHTASPLRAWLLRVAAHRCIDEGRRRHPLRFSDVRSCGLDTGEMQEETLLEEQLVDPSPLPEEVAERRELQSSLHIAIGTLPEKFRRIVWLHYIEAFTFKEIGHRLHQNLFPACSFPATSLPSSRGLSKKETGASFWPTGAQAKRCAHLLVPSSSRA
jgi:RNA polymerase sigma-70 factor, ECF subfamily